jgi:gamma-glutamylcyclotransferase (GGCT)/AIG2-like uncharacterized protein YtfP
MTLIFVYGTLKRGGRNHRFMAGQRFVGEAGTGPGFILYSLGKYPGMVRSAQPDHHVLGELWAVDDNGLKALDALEGVDEQLYERVAVTLAAPYAQQPVETYLYLRNIDGRPMIGSVWQE